MSWIFGIVIRNNNKYIKGITHGREEYKFSQYDNSFILDGAPLSIDGDFFKNILKN